MAKKLARNTNICFDCENYCSCEWGRLNPDTKKPAFEPVPGWDAEEVDLKFYNKGHGYGSVVLKTYHIKSCPRFIPTPDRTIERKSRKTMRMQKRG